MTQLLISKKTRTWSSQQSINSLKKNPSSSKELKIWKRTASDRSISAKLNNNSEWTLTKATSWIGPCIVLRSKRRQLSTKLTTTKSQFDLLSTTTTASSLRCEPTGRKKSPSLAPQTLSTTSNTRSQTAPTQIQTTREECSKEVWTGTTPEGRSGRCWSRRQMISSTSCPRIRDKRRIWIRRSQSQSRER